MRMPMKPVSFMTSRMSVNGTRGNEFHRLAPSAHRTFRLAGRRPAARASVVPRSASAVRRVIVNDVTRFGARLPGVGQRWGRRFRLAPQLVYPTFGTVHTLAQIGAPIFDGAR